MHPVPAPPVEPLLRAPVGHINALLDGLTLLVAGFVHRGVPLDLYGAVTLDDGVELVDAAFAGSRISMAELLPRSELAELERWCEQHLPGASEAAETDQWISQHGRWHSS